MRRTTSLVAASIVAVLSPAAWAADVLSNGGFETEGLAGPADSASWVEIAAGAPGTFSERVFTEFNTGAFSHRLAAVGANGIGSTAVIIQNSIADGGLASLQGGSSLSARFNAKINLGPGGVMFYTLRVLNSSGAIVANSGLQVATSGTNGAFAPFTMGPITVPVFDVAPNDAFAAFVEISVAAGAFPESTAEAFIDDVAVTGTLVNRCVADVDNGSGTGTPDGGVGIEDLLYYLSLYDAGVGAADVDDGSSTGTPDGGVGIEDLLYYLQRYDAGC